MNIVVTGATNGIGRIAAMTLARPGVRLILIARDKAKAETTRTAILESVPVAQVDFVYADFTRLRTVATAAATIAERYDRIDVLINNAGIHAFEPRVTADGFGEMISVNYLAPWLITAILRRRLIDSAPSRIVTVASEASRQSRGVDPRRDLRDITPFTKLGSSVIYGRTKLMNIMFSMELARRLEGAGVTANCLDPGFNTTGLGRDLPFAGLLERALKTLGIGNPEHGAGIIVRLASDPAFATVSGGYFSVRDAKPIVPIAPGGDSAERQSLWAATTELLREYHPDVLGS